VLPPSPAKPIEEKRFTFNTLEIFQAPQPGTESWQKEEIAAAIAERSAD
jgi:hypothetical protein